MRPLTPIYTRIEEILGEEIHDAMAGRVSDQEALQKAQLRIQRILDIQEQSAVPA